jgi:hypothetical protein
MADSPDKLCAICLRKLTSILKHDELIWKKKIEERIDRIHREEKSHSSSSDLRKRKYNRTDEDNTIQPIDYSINEVKYLI